MLKGFPGDFPISNKNNETGLFVRNEIDDNRNFPLTKKVKIAEEIVEIEKVAEVAEVVEIKGQEGKENQSNNLRHVKFSGAPPVEYSTFPDSEYDRSPLNKPTCCKWKRQLIYKHTN